MDQRAYAVTLEAEVHVPFATVQIARFDVMQPADDLMQREADTYRLDLSLSPRSQNARACYRDHWSPHRFERLGKLFALPPGKAVHARTDSGSVHTSLICHLRPEPMREWFGGELEWTDPRLKASLDVANAHVCSSAQRVAEELRHPGFASETLIELMVAQTAIELGRYWSAIESIPASGGLAPWRIRLINERLREVAEPPTLTELATLCRLSVRQLTRGFRASYQHSIGDHMAYARLDQARRLLTGGESVKAVAHAVGFATPSSFIAAFRRATGETPRQFRLRSSAKR